MKGMRVVWVEKGRVALEEYMPAEPARGEVLIETEYTLISPGTELAFLHALPNTSGRFPQYPGYNNVGRIARLGEEVVGLSVGDRVISHSRHASAVIALSSELSLVPDGLDPKIAVYSTMLAIALQGVRKAQIELGEGVVVLGQGIIGNLAMQLARLSGGLPVVGTDLYDSRLGVSRTCGADAVVNRKRAGLPAIREAVGRASAAIIIDATGDPEALHDCLDLLGYRSRLVLLASTRGETTAVNFYADIHKRGATIIGAHDFVRPKAESTRGYWTRVDDWGVVLKLMAAGRLLVDPLTSDVLPFGEAPRGYESLSVAKDRHLGVILDWTQGN